MPAQPPPLPWLVPGQEFPPASQSWDQDSPAPGLVAAGGRLDVETLRRAYSEGIFPWFSKGQPILWWSPDPRMVLPVSEFQIHLSFKKAINKFRSTVGCEIRVDSAFDQVIDACAVSPRAGGQTGTWIVPEMIAAYAALHRAGLAHSVETWINDELVGGLYCVAVGKSVFGESMFSRSANASKIALAALVGFCRHHSIEQIDCQQNTPHLASLGAREISRNKFMQLVKTGLYQTAPAWEFDPIYWQKLLISEST